MNIHHILKQNKDRWWALPLILPVVLLPVLSVANTLTQLGDGSLRSIISRSPFC